MNRTITISSIAEIHHMLGVKSPMHPLVSVVKHVPEMNTDLSGATFAFELYFISLKSDIRGSFAYGRKTYDFKEGSMLFVSPGQTISVEEASALDFSGWTLFFHPDLLRRHNLGLTIQNYSFFNYSINEALQLSQKEKQSLTEFVTKIETEIGQNLDKHSQELIVHNLAAILKYSTRFYDRQFLTRTNESKDCIAKFEHYLKEYFDSGDLSEKGLPTLTQCGEAVAMSGPYLSDVLRAETGKSAKEHIHLQLIDRAKSALLGTQKRVSNVAYDLGFEYPQNFSKLFKLKTGLSPTEYRNNNKT